MVKKKICLYVFHTSRWVKRNVSYLIRKLESQTKINFIRKQVAHLRHYRIWVNTYRNCLLGQVPERKTEMYSSCTHKWVPQLCFSVPCLIFCPESNIVLVLPILASGHCFSEHKASSPPSSCFLALTLSEAWLVLFCPLISQAIFNRPFFLWWLCVSLAEILKNHSSQK